MQKWWRKVRVEVDAKFVTKKKKKEEEGQAQILIRICVEVSSYNKLRYKSSIFIFELVLLLLLYLVTNFASTSTLMFLSHFCIKIQLLYHFWNLHEKKSFLNMVFFIYFASISTLMVKRSVSTCCTYYIVHSFQ